MESFEAIYCVIEDIVCVVDDEDIEYTLEVDECPNCNANGIIKVQVTEIK